MTTFVMVLDEVLRRTKDQSTNLQGMHLYNALSSVGRLVLLTGTDEEKADWFLRTNGFTRHSGVIPEREESASTQAGRRMAQITELRAQGANVEFVVEPNPEIAEELFRKGIPVLLYLHPRYSQPSFRPDYRSVATPWENLTKEVNYQEEMRALHAYDDKDPL